MKAYTDAEVDLSALHDKTVAIIGYGNQGRAQGLNLRDSGISVLVGCMHDASAETARADGFDVLDIHEAARRADIICMLIPDEVQAGVYEEHVAPVLEAGNALDFAHGYNIRFGFITPPDEVDVIMVAPRMIGARVRDAFVEGAGSPAYIAVARDATGKAHEIALALAKGIGATRAGVLETTFEHETDLDLFTEQALWPALTRTMLLAFEVLVEAGWPAEMVALELYGSGEAGEIMTRMAEVGFFKQMALHSHTSQYGTLSRAERMVPGDMRERMSKALAAIRDGSFAQEWAQDQAAGYPRFEILKRTALAHPINEAEEKLRRLLNR